MNCLTVWVRQQWDRFQLDLAISTCMRLRVLIGHPLSYASFKTGSSLLSYEPFLE